MTKHGLLTLLLPFLGIGSVPAHHEPMEMVEFVRIFLTSYRHASTEFDSSLVYARFIFGFCRAIAVDALL